jgi:hypothetical protein
MPVEQIWFPVAEGTPSKPSVDFTGFSDDIDERHAREIGIKGFLKKPVATGDLTKMIRKVQDESKDSTQGYVILWLNNQGPIFLWIPIECTIRYFGSSVKSWHKLA